MNWLLLILASRFGRMCGLGADSVVKGFNRMKVKLTPSGVKDIPLPESGKKIYWCSELIGFGVRAVPSGKSYVVRTRVGGGRQGRDVIYSVGRCNEISLPVARTKAMDALARLRSGTDLLKEKALKAEQEKAESLTLRELFN